VLLQFEHEDAPTWSEVGDAFMERLYDDLAQRQEWAASQHLDPEKYTFK
jgi:hypothetical protein